MTRSNQPHSSLSHDEPANWVVCLCAAWCGVCRDYRAVFDGLAAAWPEVRFVWVDVEDEEELAGDVDVDTFPTLLVGRDRTARFFGPLLPQPAVLGRLLESLLTQEGPPAQPEAQALLARIIEAHSQRAA